MGRSIQVMSRSSRIGDAVTAAQPVAVAVFCFLLSTAQAQPILKALRGRLNNNTGSSSSAPQTFPWMQSTASSSAAPGDHWCRMEHDAAHSFCGLPYELSNFQGHFKCDKSVMVGRPATWEQAANLVRAYDHVKAVGIGDSWWKEQFCSGHNSSSINIVTTEFTYVLPAMQGSPQSAITIDESAMTVTAAAGVTQRTLLKFLDSYKTGAAPEGYTLAAFSWFIDQTIGGAVATATHGSSFLYGSLSSQLKSVKLMDAQGNIRTITPADDHLWKAATVSVGRLGITLEVTFMIVKNTDIRRGKTDISVDDFVNSVAQLQQQYTAAKANNSLTSWAVWQAIKPWNEVQMFWFVPSRVVWKVTFTKLAPVVDAEAITVLAAHGPSERSAAPEGAYHQEEVKAAGSGIGIETNPLYWSDLYRVYMAANVEPATLPARESYVSVSELETRLSSSWNSYDQYEVAIPLTKAGDCLKAVKQELYGPKQRWKGFRVPGLVRFVKAEHSYLAPTNGEHTMYINIEDHVSYATMKPNEDFQAIISVFRSPVCGPARLHWGKAGWPRHVQCFDGAKEYPNTWCDFGCAVKQLDPNGKFASEAGRDIWQWNAVDTSTGRAMSDFAGCCNSAGFMHEQCKCASRSDCAPGPP